MPIRHRHPVRGRASTSGGALSGTTVAALPRPVVRPAKTASIDARARCDVRLQRRRQDPPHARPASSRSARTIFWSTTMGRPTAPWTTSGPGIIVLRNPTNQGIGAAMKRVFRYSLDNGYDVLVIQAGNDKDDPLEIPSLLAPLRGRHRRLRPGIALSRSGGGSATCRPIVFRARA